MTVRTVVHRCIVRRVVFLAVIAGTAACGETLPSGVQDPSHYANEQGSVQLYHGVLSAFQLSFINYVQSSGVLSDELQDRNIGGSRTTVPNGLDTRIIALSSGIGTDTYTGLQRVRGNASQAIGSIAKYGPGLSPAIRGELYAVAGYAELMLADFFCSGVPLSTIDFEKDYTYKPGSSTEDVYRHAAALFDTAITLSADSTRVLGLARVGRGRALLALGDYAGAAAAVAAVPVEFRYDFPVAWTATGASRVFTLGTVSDHEGVNGLPYISSQDPRTQVIPDGTNNNQQPLTFPAKYGSPSSTSPIVVADGIEAELIRAEVKLRDNDPAWLDILNALRTDSTYTTVQNAGDPLVTDTLWNAGTAGISGLAPLGDPGSATARLDLVFAERAYWLFITGHRQGDLRRLIREYGRPGNQVYPTGTYPGGAAVYGSDVTVPVPQEEKQNPLFTGCFDRNA